MSIKNKIGVAIEVLGLLFIFYIIGFVFCLGAFVMGADGTDMLSQHYRSVIGLII